MLASEAPKYGAPKGSNAVKARYLHGVPRISHAKLWLETDSPCREAICLCLNVWDTSRVAVKRLKLKPPYQSVSSPFVASLIRGPYPQAPSSFVAYTYMYVCVYIYMYIHV